MSASSGGFGGFEDLGSIFEEMFSGFGAQRRKNPAQSDKYRLDMGIELDITFHEAVFGCETEISYTV